MLVFRSLVLGLLGATVVLLVQRPVYVVTQPIGGESPPTAAARTTAPPAVAIVDVAPGVGAQYWPALFHLGDDERIVAVDDRPVANQLEAGMWMTRPRAPGSFIDLAVAGPSGTRRVLVLLHAGADQPLGR
jgi:hypothetical protein